jgi:ATP-dependent DNA helicase RecQ
MSKFKTPLELLKEIYGYDNYRKNQLETIDNLIVKNKNTLAILPTGGGKSVTFQVPSQIYDGLVIVISPLISLMKDQVDELKEKYNIKGEYLNSTSTKEERKEIYKKIYNNNLDLLYVSPENIIQTNILDMLIAGGAKISLFAIDEAHCLSTWGHDFRKDYQMLSILPIDYPEIPILALTATADKNTINDICSTLNINDEDVFKSTFDRDNLTYLILQKKKDYYTQLKNIIKKNHKNEQGIIYCFTKKECESITNKLNKDFFKAETYHADVDKDKKVKIQENFKNGEINIIVATTAFGMGINVPNIRFVINNSLPYSVEDYFQQSGRAGRDGLESVCYLLASSSDQVRLSSIIKMNDEENIHNNEVNHNMLKFMSMVKIIKSQKCRRLSMLSYFGEHYEKDNCGKCDICLGMKNITLLDEKKSKIIIKEVLKGLITLRNTSMSFLILFLIGKKTKETKYHENKNNFGVLKNEKEIDLKHYINEIMFEDLIEKTRKKIQNQNRYYESLSISTYGRKFLENEDIKITLTKINNNQEYNLVENKTNENKKNINSNLINKLKNKRKEIADQKGLQPRMIFPDKTLIEMSIKCPKTKNEMLSLTGVGELKYNKYGIYFLNICSTY